MTFAIVEAIPQVLQLVVGIVGLAVSVRGRATGTPGLMVGAFVVMLATSVLGIVWQFVSLNSGSWQESGHLTENEMDSIFLGVDVPLSLLAALSWLLVVIAVVKARRSQPAGPAGYAPAVGYPMGQPGYPQPGYAQSGYSQAGYPGYQQPGYQPPQQQPQQPQS